MSQLYHFEELTSRDKRFVRACGIRTPNPDRRASARIAKRETRNASRQLNYFFAASVLAGGAIICLAIVGLCAILDGRIF
jgi:hypothetical protein